MKLKGKFYKNVVRPAMLYMVYGTWQQREDNKRDYKKIK